MTSTINFDNGINVVFGIRFYFTTGRVPIVRGLRFSRPYPTFDGMPLGYEQRGSEFGTFCWSIVSPDASRCV